MRLTGTRVNREYSTAYKRVSDGYMYVQADQPQGDHKQKRELPMPGNASERARKVQVQACVSEV